MQQVVVLGATGTIGRNTLDVIRRNADRYTVVALTAHRDVAGLVDLCREFRPAHAALGDVAAAKELARQLTAAALPTKVGAGLEAIAELAALSDADQVMCGIVGAAGLLPTLAAVRAGKRVLIANKEPLVMAGALVLAEAKRHDATLIPIDSEHNAIFQCLPPATRCGVPSAGVRRLILTASGGPFRTTPLAALAQVTPEQAVRHPNWVMGRKISVDSATMMNKGLELIEAAVLYGLPETQLDVVIHPESAIHSIVEYVDGSMLAQMGQPDMRVPIAHAMAWPERQESGVAGLDLAAMACMHFEAPDAKRFPALELARAAMRQGGAAPNVLNAANEVAVQGFLDGLLPYLGMHAVIERTLERAQREGVSDHGDLESILAVDAWARACAAEALSA